MDAEDAEGNNSGIKEQGSERSQLKSAFNSQTQLNRFSDYNMKSADSLVWLLHQYSSA